MSRRFSIRASWLAGCILAGVVVATAQEPLRENTALRFIPADASFFYSRLRMKQQYEAVIKSRAWSKLMAVPAMKFIADVATSTRPPELGGEQGWFAPENKELRELVFECLSQEAFVYGSADFTDFMAAYLKLARAVNMAQLEEIRKGGNAQDKAAQDRVVEAMLAEIGGLKFPDMLIGFKIADAKRTEGQLARLEKLLREQLEAKQDFQVLKTRLVREKIAGAEFLTMRLDGGVIPWEQLRRDMPAENRAQADKLIEKIKGKTLAINLGVWNGYLLLSIGDTDEHLRKLGQGPLLIDRPELAALRQQGDKPLLSVSYASQKFMQSASSVDVQIDNYVGLAEQMLPLSELDAELQKEMIADARLLAADLKKAIPKPGAALGFTFLSSRGSEGYSYNWGEHPQLDGSQPLSILDHVGGEPLAFVAGRAKYVPESYDMLVKWLSRGWYYGERLGLPTLPAEQLALYQKLKADFQPLVTRLDQAIKTLWIPAFKDGQSALVLDAKVTSSKWHQDMPPAAAPLPMLEIGLVYGVSDPQLLKRASSELFSISEQALKLAHAAAPTSIPEVPLTPPRSREFPEGTIYFYSPPAEWGLDPQIAANAGLSQNTLTLSLIPKFSLRLLQKTPLQKDGPLARRDRPLAAAGYLNWASLIDALRLWIDYGFEQSATLIPAAGVQGVDPSVAQSAKEVVHATLEFLQCLRSVSSVSYVENGALVTHSEWQFVDSK